MYFRWAVTLAGSTCPRRPEALFSVPAAPERLPAPACGSSAVAGRGAQAVGHGSNLRINSLEKPLVWIWRN